MKLYVWEDERHIQVNEFYVDNMEKFHIFWKDLQEKYMGFTIDFCYHNCPVPIEYMLKINAVLLESCVETRLTQENFTPVEMYDLTLVTTENFKKFAKLHDLANPVSSGMFWTSERIKKDLTRWLIYIYENNYVLMRMGNDESEFYAIETMDRSIGEILISKASKDAFKAGKTGILVMVDDDDLKKLEMYQGVGFLPCGKYIAYQSTIR